MPPPTPITLPRYQPLTEDRLSADDDGIQALLQNVGKTSRILGPAGFSAIGLDLVLDAAIQDIVPRSSCIPDFARWEELSQDSAQEQNEATRHKLRNENLSPGCNVYLERKKELANANEDAFRTVRRLPAPKGTQQARLGNAYEFFRCLELFTGFWDDPTHPADMPPSPELSASEIAAASEEAERKAELAAHAEDTTTASQRVAAGSAMPAEHRQSLISALIKLIAYDFGCSVSSARSEPRLQLSSSNNSRKVRKTYCPSNCTFVFQSPMTREAARAGIVHGPVAAVSARNCVDFTTPDVETAQSVDLAREIVAALIAAQHRSREGTDEKRFGQGKWWTTKPRWGGGTGGPIGREIEKYALQGDTDVPPADENGLPTPVIKKAKKTMSIYDSYRMVRPPASTWDHKARYEAVGKHVGSNYDDIFVFSSVFHHVSIIRVRVPARLLQVLDGEPEPLSRTGERTWGKVQAWRTRWFDLFSVFDRTEAMKFIWGVMAYQMRKDMDDQDTSMTGA